MGPPNTGQFKIRGKQNLGNVFSILRLSSTIVTIWISLRFLFVGRQVFECEMEPFAFYVCAFGDAFQFTVFF